jgi:hypothetical protein
MSQKHQNIKRLVCKININKGSISHRGSAFIINKNGIFFLVTAKHCFYPSSSQQGYTIPTYDESLTEVLIMNPSNTQPIHTQNLVDSESQNILYKIHRTHDDKVLDIAILKLKNPNEEVKNLSIKYSQIKESKKINRNKKLMITGYPSKNENSVFAFNTTYSNEELQALLENDSEYFFLMDVEIDLKGISGCPIFQINQNEELSIVGIFVGQNRKIKNLGYGIFSCFIKEVIDSYSE